MSIRGEHADGHPVYSRDVPGLEPGGDGIKFGTWPELRLPASELIAEHQGHGMPATYFGDCEQCHAQMPHEHAV